MPREHESRDWADAPINQGMPMIVSKSPKA